MRNKHGIMVKSSSPKAWTEDLINSISAGLSLVVDAVEQEEFVQRCIEAVPERAATKGKRDTRRQDIVRSLRRLAETGKLPFRVAGDQFVF